ncbi:hypothetical protein PMAYCL1PPCAC_28303, partial [Pristionchus mayeri]
MKANVLDLPIELVDYIFRLLDTKSLLTLRSVSQITKELAESVFMNQTQKPLIEELFLNKKKLEADLTPSDTIFLFDLLTPLMCRLQSGSLALNPSTDEMFSLTSKFFDGKTVETVQFKLDHSD